MCARVREAVISSIVHDLFRDHLKLNTLRLLQYVAENAEYRAIINVSYFYYQIFTLQADWQSIICGGLRIIKETLLSLQIFRDNPEALAVRISHSLLPLGWYWCPPRVTER